MVKMQSKKQIYFPKVNRKLLPFKAHFFLYQGGTSPLTPFLTTIGKERGYSALLVGIMFSVLHVVSVTSRPVFGAITDRFRCQKKMFLLTMAMLILITASYGFMPDSSANVDSGDDVAVLRTYQFWLFFVFLAIRNVTKNVNSTLADTMCLQVLGKNTHNIGKQKLWGSLGWGLGSMTTGWLVDWYSSGKVVKDYTPGVIVSTVFLTADLLTAIKIHDFQSDIVPKNSFRDLKKVLNDIKIVSFTIWVIFFGIFYESISNYLFWHVEELVTKYHPEKYSSIKLIQGTLIAVKCFGSQAPFFFLSGKIIKKVGHLNSITIGLASLSAKCFLYFLIKDPIWLLPVELLSGLSFALPHSAMVAYGSVIAPEGLKGTIQGLFRVVFQGIGMSLGSLITGYLVDKIGSSDTFLVYSIWSLAISFLLVVTSQTIPKMTKSKMTEILEVNAIT